MSIVVDDPSEIDFELDDLTAEERAELASFQNPDEPKAAAEFKWDIEFQREILGLIMTDQPFAESQRQAIRPNYFSNTIHQQICRIIFEHLDCYHVLPGR